ncbi:MAG: hypothetical protein KF760_24275 [Candidatus Eremiobacteraeota bacterium]|nr:hypothetical protein [Candidatus Eremiobacteraeota bacterium]MCW5867495.1 hypothetical protein [Candidatus Eremiobacteraeota bacterium]
MSQTHPAFEVLNYNQQLIQFADAKAGNLIVINSLFIAAAQAGHSSSHPLLLKLVQVPLVLAAGLALAMCLLVIMNRAGLPKMPRKDCIFFGDIAQRKNMNQFVQDFTSCPEQQHLEDSLRRTYILALIANRKFSIYGWAQMLTAAAALIWLGHSALSIVLA